MFCRTRGWTSWNHLRPAGAAWRTLLGPSPEISLYPHYNTKIFRHFRPHDDVCTTRLPYCVGAGMSPPLHDVYAWLPLKKTDYMLSSGTHCSGNDPWRVCNCWLKINFLLIKWPRNCLLAGDYWAPGPDRCSNSSSSSHVYTYSHMWKMVNLFNAGEAFLDIERII